MSTLPRRFSTCSRSVSAKVRWQGYASASSVISPIAAWHARTFSRCARWTWTCASAGQLALASAGGIAGCHACTDLDTAISDADIIMVLRLQLERQEKGLIPSLREYSQLYGLNLKRLDQAKPDVLIMHPGPINRGVEIALEVAEGPYSLILDQVANGVALRMALLYLLTGGPGL